MCFVHGKPTYKHKYIMTYNIKTYSMIPKTHFVKQLNKNIILNPKSPN